MPCQCATALAAGAGTGPRALARTRSSRGRRLRHWPHCSLPRRAGRRATPWTRRQAAPFGPITREHGQFNEAPTSGHSVAPGPDSASESPGYSPLAAWPGAPRRAGRGGTRKPNVKCHATAPAARPNWCPYYYY